MATVTVREMRPEDRDGAVRALTIAFKDDPVNRWIGSRPERDALLWQTMLKYIHAGSAIDLAWHGARVVGVAVWDQPGHKVPWLMQVRSGPHFLRALGSEARKGPIIDKWLEAYRPKQPHWYLAHLGAVEGGRGIGSALLGYRLARIDADPVRLAYLESSNARNLPLYERFGFTETSLIDGGPDGAPPIWGMLRPPVD